MGTTHFSGPVESGGGFIGDFSGAFDGEFTGTFDGEFTGTFSGTFEGIQGHEAIDSLELQADEQGYDHEQLPAVADKVDEILATLRAAGIILPSEEE